MGFDVLVSGTFQRWFDGLDAELQDRIREGLEALQEDPYEPRSGADIRPLTNTQPTKHRLRVGEVRIVYHVDEEEDIVRIIEGFRRGRGYR